MLNPPMNQLLAKIPNRYLLVNAIARRSRQVQAEAEMADVPLTRKPVSIAIDEIANDRYTVKAQDGIF